MVQTQEWGYQVATASLLGAVVGSLVYRQRMTVGDLFQARDGRWIEAPTHCPMGHRLGPNRCLIRHTAGHGGGHVTWTCCACDQTVYVPPLITHCKVHTGPDGR